MLPTVENISNLVENQFPSFYKEEGPKFIAFVKAYYEWLEESGKTNDLGRNLFSLRDIDTTSTQFLDEFRKKYQYVIPKNIPGDTRFLQKHILDLYRSKGSVDGLKLFFRLLYNEDVDIYIPSYDILKPSDGKWIERKYIEGSYSDYNQFFENKAITGSQSGATAYVEAYVKNFINGRVIHLFFLSDIQGSFLVGERIAYASLDFNLAPKIQGSPVSINVSGTTPNNATGDTLLPSAANGSGVGLKTLASKVRIAGSSNATIDFKIINGGSGYTTSPTITITTGSNTTGSGATFTGVILSNVSSFSYSLSYINNLINRTANQSFNANTAVANATEYISFANNTYANGDYVQYTTAAGNTALSGLSNGSYYFVRGANSTALQLAAGNTITYNTSPLNLTAGASETGHYLSLVPITNLAINAVTYGSTLNNASLSTVLDSALTSQTISVGTISQLTGINLGSGYDGYVNIQVTEPKLVGYGIPDGSGGVTGNNAVLTGNVVLGTGLVQNVVVKNSGYGYHTLGESIQLFNSTQANTNQITQGTINLGAVGFSEGFWQGTQSFLDSNKYIQDSHFYQEYSYEIKFVTSIHKYINILKELVHPVGNKVFGKTLITAKNDDEQVDIDNTFTLYRILGAALSPTTNTSVDVFTLNVSRLV
jgi:hypothetical protein